MKISPPLVGFVVGVVVAELYQWAAWKAKHPAERATGYWGVGLPHLVMNACGDLVVAALWSANLLDDVVLAVSGWLRLSSEWASSGIPYTPQVGIAVGAASDLFADNLAFLVGLLWTRLVARLKGGQEAPGPPLPPAEATT